METHNKLSVESSSGFHSLGLATKSDGIYSNKCDNSNFYDVTKNDIYICVLIQPFSLSCTCMSVCVCVCVCVCVRVCVCSCVSVYTTTKKNND